MRASVQGSLPASQPAERNIFVSRNRTSRVKRLRNGGQSANVGRFAKLRQGGLPQA
jgi:hypothetical protein